MSELAEQVRALLDEALRCYTNDPAAATLEAARERLQRPLRVAIAGKVKAGKSTLLNALVGEELAPTDAGECTRIVTWYHDGVTARVELYAPGLAPRQVQFVRSGGALEIDLGGTDQSTIERLDVTWPSQRLRDMTLIDTPGIGSISHDISKRTIDFLVDDEHRSREADAVIYLMRHVDAADADFLEAFNEDDLTRPSPVNSIAVLSRADELGACRLDAIDTAHRIAERHRNDPNLRRLCQTVVPLAGLLAQASATLTEAEFRALMVLARMPTDRLDLLLLSVDRFVADDATVPVTAIEREDLLARLGLFGVRLGLDAIAAGHVSSSRQFVELLRAKSGLDELRATLLREFGGRAAVLKARSALDVLDETLRTSPIEGSEALGAAFERVVAGAHELAEIRALNILRSGSMVLSEDSRTALELLLSAGSSNARLGIDEGAANDALRAAALASLTRWQTYAQNPLASQAGRDVARVAVRSCEGLIAEITGRSTGER